MKSKIIYSLIMAGTMIPFVSNADPATPAPAPNGSVIETNLNVSVKDEENTVHLISTTADPDILTKTFVLKHADPYEIRPYLRGAAASERITGGENFVSCLKYKDGTGIVIVSAEDYKFSKEALKKQGLKDEDCMCIAEIVKKFDLPGLTSSSGQKKFMYFPKYRSATDIARMALESGLDATNPNDTTEFINGSDNFRTDDGLNAVLFYANPYNIETIYGRLAIYDKPIPEAKVSVKVYELDYENDGKVGADFQAWKNGPGNELFSIAPRFSQGMQAGNPVGTLNGTKWSNAKVIQLSPRWNTRFLDFLAAKGKAHTVVEGTLNIRNNEQGHLENTIGIPSFGDGARVANNSYFDYEELFGSWVEWGADAADNSENRNYTFVMYDTKGTPITLNEPSLSTTIRFTRVLNTNGLVTEYSAQIISGTGSLAKNGKVLGKKATGFGLQIRDSADAGDWAAYTSNWTSNLSVQRSFQRDTQLTNYGFWMTIEPTICKESTTLALNIQNTSLLGFTENFDGATPAPRTKTSQVNTEIMVNNENRLFLIGGIEKTTKVRSVSKVPWLGSLPLVGWLFTSESEATKKTQLVTVVECEHQAPEQDPPLEFSEVVKVIEEDTVDAGKTNTYGYDQWILDKDKKSFNKLP
jgi:general secretion pathway protein D